MSESTVETLENNRVVITIEEHIAHVQMIRDDKMNALDPDMFAGLIDAASKLEDREDVRAVVLSGRGRAFCAGLDMSNFTNMAEGGAGKTKPDLAVRTHGDSNDFQQVCQAWHKLPMPVIGAAHNVCLGGGMHIFLGCDIRFAAPATRFSIMEIRWGLIPDMGSTPILPHIARRDVISELTYTGRIFETDEARELGFVTRVHDDPVAEAMATAKIIASKNPTAIRANKMIINQAAYLSPAEALMLESVEQDKIIGSANQIESVMSELEGREASYKG
ncbi:MAG: crotonase/enoyl-CoA hydratase family protein [Pseudomonadales bacterium]